MAPIAERAERRLGLLAQARLEARDATPLHMKARRRHGVLKTHTVSQQIDRDLKHRCADAVRAAISSASASLIRSPVAASSRRPQLESQH